MLMGLSGTHARNPAIFAIILLHKMIYAGANSGGEWDERPDVLSCLAAGCMANEPASQNVAISQGVCAFWPGIEVGVGAGEGEGEP